MKNFLRAVRLGLRHRWTLASALFCSLMVALFWGANIGTVYPIVEIVFQGKSVPGWLDEEVERLERQTGQRATQLAEQRARLAQGSGLAGEQQKRTILEAAQALQDAELKALDLRRRLRPWAARFMPNEPFQTLVLVVGVMLLGTLIKDVFLMGSMILVERFSQLATFGLRNEFYRRTLRMDVAAFGDDRTSNLMARFTNDMNSMNQGINNLVGKSIREPLKMVVCLVGAAWICWRLLVFSLFVLPLALYLIAAIAKRIKQANRRAMEEMSQLYGVLNESFAGIETVQACTMERHERGRFYRSAKEYFRRAMRIMTFNSLARPTTELMGMVIVSLAMLAGGYLVLNQETHLLGIRMSTRPLGFGALITFYALLIGASDPLRKLADVFNSVQRSCAAADRIYEMLDREPSIQNAERPLPLPNPVRQLEFRAVNFHYLPEEPLLKDIQLTIPSGQTIAIMGPNGSGKSSLLNLVPRFYDPIGGQVLLDETELSQIRLSHLRQVVGVVTQQPFLFDVSIMDNIRYGSPSASDEDVVTAARQAHADVFIQTLDAGYETNVGESGGRLSGGQRQRIALARTILRDPKIVLLDEATSQVDGESEELICDALARFLEGRIGIMITHRPATLALADRIVLMEQGRIVDVGTDQELLGRSELYRRLCQLPLKDSA